MAPSAKSELTTRLAIVGAASPDGGLLREALAGRRVPGARVELFGTVSGEAVVSDYAGEARLVQDPDIDSIVSRDVVFLCERGEIARRIADAAVDSLVIDVVGALADGSSTTRVHLGLRGDDVPVVGGARLRIPHSLSLVLLDVLHPLGRELELSGATAVILQPASQRGQAGIEELKQQTVRLLNFSELPTEVFGRQLAFNVLHESRIATSSGLSSRRIVDDVLDLLAWPPDRFALDLLTVPVFFGHSLSLHVRADQPIAADEVGSILREAGLSLAADGEGGTPLDVTGEMRTVVASVRLDGGGGCWIWVVVGEADGRAAELAVRVAARAARL